MILSDVKTILLCDHEVKHAIHTLKYNTYIYSHMHTFTYNIYTYIQYIQIKQRYILIHTIPTDTYDTYRYIRIHTDTYSYIQYIHIHTLQNQRPPGFLTLGSGRVRPRGAAPPTQISSEGASDGTYVLHLPTGGVFSATEMCFDPPRRVC